MSPKSSTRKSNALFAACKISDAGTEMKSNFHAREIAEVAATAFPTAPGTGL
jgi:hypothetical protein